MGVCDLIRRTQREEYPTIINGHKYNGAVANADKHPRQNNCAGTGIITENLCAICFTRGIQMTDFKAINAARAGVQNFEF